MAYRIAQGNLIIDGKSPDGDTIAFALDEENRGLWVWPKEQDGRFPRFNSLFHANIRFEAIDALELHYQIQNVYPGVNSHQPLSLARQARDRLLEICGFNLDNVTETANLRLKDPDQQKKPATIAYKDIDPFGRIVAFVFVDKMGFKMDDKNPTVFLEPEHLERSVNIQLLREGLVYPTFYGGFYPELRNAVTVWAREARDQNRGLWQTNVTEFTTERKPSLEVIEELVMLPKIFRRLATHLARNGAISNFRGFMGETGDTVVDTRQVRLTGLQSFVGVKKVNSDQYKVRLQRNAEELIFLPS